jgi:hypothetical protein
VRLSHHSNYFLKVIYLYRALGRCLVPRAPVGLAGARPPLALAWPLASCKFQYVCGFAAAFGCRRPAKSRSVQVNQFIRTVGRFCRYSTLKSHARGKQSLLRTMLQKREQKGKFFRRQKFALLPKKEQ